MSRTLLILKWLAIWVIASLPLESAQRIVSTTPSITEILFALGLGDQVVGVSTYCRYPEAAKRLPKVGTFIEPNIEAILQQRPTLVIIQTNPVRLAERLTTVKLPVLEVNPVSMDGVHQAILAIGKAGGVAERARMLSEKLKMELEAYRTLTARMERKKVAFVVGRTAGTLEGVIVVAKGSYLAELLQLAGGNNVFADSIAPYPKVSHEDLIARNPELILDMGDSMPDGLMTEALRKSVIQLWSRLPMIQAVKNGRVYPLADDRLIVPGPRMVEAVRLFGKMLHPELSW